MSLSKISILRDSSADMRGLREKVTIRAVETIQEMRGIEALQREVWGPLDTVPLSHLVATKAAGGLIIAGFHQERVIGFVYGFIGKENDRYVLHSHMLAVKSEYRGIGLGYELKLAQRQQAKTMGFDVVNWTFDPLQSRNAHLNFSKLGVIGGRYVVDFYGPEPAGLTALHLETDRLWVTWLINSSRVTKRLNDPERFDTTAVRAKLERSASLVEVGADELPFSKELKELPSSHDYIHIEVPNDISSLTRSRPEAARAWREATRRAFLAVLKLGYTVEEFYSRSVSGKRGGTYILSPKVSLECKD